jgi:hypothetical protein
MSELAGSTLAEMLAVAVPRYAAEIAARGGPSDEDMARAQALAGDLLERGDVLLFGSKKRGETADLFERTAHAIAMLSFAPSGVRLFGHDFETKIAP